MESVYSSVGTQSLNIIQVNLSCYSVIGLRRWFTRLPPRRPELSPRTVRFMLEKWHREKFFLWRFGFLFSALTCIFMCTIILPEAWKYSNSNSLRQFGDQLMYKYSYIYIYIYIYTFIYFPPNSHLRHRALSLAPPAPLRGGTKNDGSYADTFNTGEAPLSRRTGSRSPCHYSHQSWCTGVWIRFGLPRCNLFIPGFF